MFVPVTGGKIWARGNITSPLIPIFSFMMDLECPFQAGAGRGAVVLKQQNKGKATPISRTPYGEENSRKLVGRKDSVEKHKMVAKMRAGVMHDLLLALRRR